VTVTPADPLPSGPWESLKRAVKTLLDNSFGSDMLTAYTAEYAWLANQMAHAMMGFFLAAIWAFAQSTYHWPGTCVWMPLAVPLLKEVTDYLIDAVFRQHTFALNHTELIGDGLTDIFFWSFGMLLAIGTFGFDAVNWYVVGGTVVVGVPATLVLLFKVWLPRERMFDFSRMPFNYVRLVKYPDPTELLGPDDVKKILDYQEFARTHESRNVRAGRHVLLAGGRPVDRSAMAVSLGCEFIGWWKGVYMISAVKLLEDPSRMTTACRMAADYKARVHCLIIDDLNVHLPIPGATREERREQREQLQQKRAAMMTQSPQADGGLANLLAAITGAALSAVAQTPTQTERVIDLIDRFDELRDEFPSVTTIWVLSGGKGDEALAREWTRFIGRLLTGAPGDGALTEIRLKDPAATSKEGV
jgi:hypothetical protein